MGIISFAHYSYFTSLAGLNNNFEYFGSDKLLFIITCLLFSYHLGHSDNLPFSFNEKYTHHIAQVSLTVFKIKNSNKFRISE